MRSARIVHFVPGAYPRVVAGQLAVSIENAKLFAATNDALDEARLLYETSRRIGTLRAFLARWLF